MKLPKHIIDRISRLFKQNFKVYETALKNKKHKRFVPKILMGILKQPSAYLSDVARSLSAKEGSMETREQKLSRFFHHQDIDLELLQAAHLSRLPGIVKDNRSPRIYGDLSEASKPWAKKMDALDWVRDASDPDHKIQPGYWINEVYVAPEKGKLFPAILYPFSTQEKGFRSQNKIIVDHMDKVFCALGNRGIWISDRGYDSKFFLWIS